MRVHSRRGPVALGPVALGPVALGPVALGPVALGPVALGPVALGPVALRLIVLRLVARGLATVAALSMGAAVLAPPASASTTAAAPRSVVATAPPSDGDVPHATLHHRPPLTCGDRVAYAGKQYCRASVEQVAATAYGSAVRVFLGQAIVLDVGADSVLVAQQRGPFCDEGTCDFALASVRVTWSGHGRPAPGSVVDLYGVSKTGSLDVVASTVVGTCDDPYRLPC